MKVELSKLPTNLLVAETFEAIHNTTVNDPKSPSNRIRADREFLDSLRQILVDMGNTAGCPEVKSAYDLMLFVQRTHGCSDYFFQTECTSRTDGTFCLNLLAPNGYAFLYAIPGVIDVNMEALSHPSLIADNYRAPSFDSQDPLLDTYRICNAVEALAVRRLKDFQNQPFSSVL